MTTIAWDGRIIAADSLTSEDSGIMHGNLDKLHVGRDFIVGLAGTRADSVRWLRTLSASTSADEIIARGYPEYSTDNDPHILLVKIGGHAYTHTQGVFVEFQGTCNGHMCWAIGSGREVAIGAMLAGASAEQAVKFAAEVDPYTGGKVVWHYA